MNPQDPVTRRDPRTLPPADFYRNHALVAVLHFACMAVMLTAALSVQAQDIFLRIGGPAAPMGGPQTAPTLAGESTDAQYTNWIPVLSMSHGVSRTVTLGGGGSAPNHSDVNLLKVTDKTTPSINLLVNGATATVTQPIDFVTIDFRTGGTSNVFYRVELRDVYITSAQISGSSGGGVPTESLSLLYTRIRWSYVQYVGGKAQPPITKGWDVAKNAPF